MKTINDREKTKFLMDVKDEGRNKKHGLNPILNVIPSIHKHYAEQNKDLIKQKLKHHITHIPLDDAEGKKLYDEWKEAVEKSEGKNETKAPAKKEATKTPVKKDKII